MSRKWDLNRYFQVWSVPAVAIFPLSHPCLASTLHMSGGENFSLKRNPLIFIVLLYFQLPNLCVARNETTSFSALLTTEQTDSNFPIPIPGRSGWWSFWGKTAYKLGGKRKLSLKKATSSCVAGFTGMLFTTHSSLAPLCRPPKSRTTLEYLWPWDPLEGRGPVEQSEADIYFPTGSLTQARDLSWVHWGRITMICGEVTMHRAVREQVGGNTIGKVFAHLKKAGQLGAHLKRLCTSAKTKHPGLY